MRKPIMVTLEVLKVQTLHIVFNGEYTHLLIEWMADVLCGASLCHSPRMTGDHFILSIHANKALTYRIKVLTYRTPILHHKINNTESETCGYHRQYVQPLHSSVSKAV